MKSKSAMSVRVMSAAFLVIILAGCNNVKGTYVCEGGILDSVRLESGDKAYVSATFFGQKQEKVGTYKVDGDTISINIGGQTNNFTHSKNTLDGGEIVGKCVIK